MDFLDQVHQVIGYDTERLEWWQMCIRAFVVFVYSIVILRISNKRIFGKQTAFDIVLGIILGSIFSRAITGNSAFFPTLIAGLALVLLHRLLGFIAAQKSWGSMIKGQKRLIIENGDLKKRQMRAASLSYEDLMEQLRAKEGTENLDVVKLAYLERNGEISFIINDEDA